MLKTLACVLFISTWTICFAQKAKQCNEVKYKFTLKDTLGQVTTYLGHGKVQVRMTAPQDLTEMTGGIIVFGKKGVDMFTKTGPLKKGESKMFVFDISGIELNGNDPLIIRKIQPGIYTGPMGEDNPDVVWLYTDSTERRVYKGNGVYAITITADEDVSESKYSYKSLFPRDTTFTFRTGPMKKGEQRTFTVKLFDYHEPQKH